MTLQKDQQWAYCKYSICNIDGMDSGCSHPEIIKISEYKKVKKGNKVYASFCKPMNKFTYLYEDIRDFVKEISASLGIKGLEKKFEDAELENFELSGRMTVPCEHCGLYEKREAKDK